MDSATIIDSGQREAAFAASFTARLAALTDFSGVPRMERDLGKAIRERIIGPDVLKELQGACSRRGRELDPLTREVALAPGTRWEKTLAWADRVLAAMPVPGRCCTDEEIEAAAIRRANELPPMSAAEVVRIAQILVSGPAAGREAADGA